MNTGPLNRLHQRAWAAGLVFVAALVAELVLAIGIPATQDDSAVKIATALAAHDGRLVAIACLSVVYSVAFVIWLWKLYELLRGDPACPGPVAPLILIGGVLFVALHAVSDIGITGLVGAKLAAYSVRHDPGISYTLYLGTYAVDSVGDVFGSLFAVATGIRILRTGDLPRWTGWVILVAAPFMFLQGFGLGGVIATFGLVLDLIGFVLLLVFIVASSVIGLRRGLDETAGFEARVVDSGVEVRKERG